MSRIRFSKKGIYFKEYDEVCFSRWGESSISFGKNQGDKEALLRSFEQSRPLESIEGEKFDLSGELRLVDFGTEYKFKVYPTAKLKANDHGQKIISMNPVMCGSVKRKVKLIITKNQFSILSNDFMVSRRIKW